MDTNEIALAFALGAVSSITGNVIYDAFYQEARRNGGKTPMHTVALGLAGAAAGGLLIYELMRVRKQRESSVVTTTVSP